jgi:hypothetical protein
VPIHDWSRIDANLFHDFHQAWTVGIRNALNGDLLPKRYSALVGQHASGVLAEMSAVQCGNRITIRHPLGRVVCVIEIVLPGNKGSRSALRSFVEKTVDFLRHGVHLLVVDLFPPSPRDPQGIHKAIWDEIEEQPFELTPDKVLALVQAGLLQGKSIGFLPTKVHVPDEKEVKKNGWPNSVGLVIDEWLLLEYACVFLPANQDALVEAVSKGLSVPGSVLRAMGVAECGVRSAECGAEVVRFVALSEIEKAVVAAVGRVDVEAVVRGVVEGAWERMRGRV